MSRVTAKVVLARMIRTLSKPEHWTKNTFAKDKRGLPVDVMCPAAVCFCLSGAKMRALASVKDRSVEYLVREAMWKASGTGFLASWNDHPRRTHAQVLKMLHRAKELA